MWAIDAWVAASPADATTRTYDWNHSLRVAAADDDRADFLATALGIPE
jgi:hypothetical protein